MRGGVGIFVCALLLVEEILKYMLFIRVSFEQRSVRGKYTLLLLNYFWQLFRTHTQRHTQLQDAAFAFEWHLHACLAQFQASYY